MATQLTLPDVSFPEEHSLASFIEAGNERVLAALRTLASELPEARFVWLAGARGSGKSHLAEGLCRLMDAWPDGYFPADQWCATEREGDFPHLACVVVDDLSQLLGDVTREQWLMHVIDVRKRSRRPTLLLAGNGPSGLSCALRDVRTRLAMAEVWWLEPLTDEMKLQVMLEFARARGLSLGEEVPSYLLRRHNRNPGHLIALLRKLDQYALRDKRRVTIPFVQELAQAGHLDGC